MTLTASPGAQSYSIGTAHVRFPVSLPAAKSGPAWRSSGGAGGDHWNRGMSPSRITPSPRDAAPGGSVARPHVPAGGTTRTICSPAALPGRASHSGRVPMCIGHRVIDQPTCRNERFFRWLYARAVALRSWRRSGISCRLKSFVSIGESCPRCRMLPAQQPGAALSGSIQWQLLSRKKPPVSLEAGHPTSLGRRVLQRLSVCWLRRRAS